MERNKFIDVLKFAGICLMIIGHSGFGKCVDSIIYSFHMPLFFIISGYLYHQKDVCSIINNSIHKLFIPYIITILIIWLGKIYVGNYLYGLGILLASGSKPVWGVENCNIGPLWYIMSYFCALVILHFLLLIKNQILALLLIVTLFEISLSFCNIWGLLPLGILPGIAGTLFMYVGYNFKKLNFSIRKYQKVLMIIGMLMWILCIWWGHLSMASHIYKLNILQIVGAVFGALAFAKLVHELYNKCDLTYFSFLGANSLYLLCIHSIDFNLGISDKFVKLIYEGQVQGIYATFKCIFSLLFAISICKLFIKYKNKINIFI